MYFMWLSNAVVKNIISVEIYFISCFYSQINKLLSGVKYHQIQFRYETLKQKFSCVENGSSSTFVHLGCESPAAQLRFYFRS